MGASIKLYFLGLFCVLSLETALAATRITSPPQRESFEVDNGSTVGAPQTIDFSLNSCDLISETGGIRPPTLFPNLALDTYYSPPNSINLPPGTKLDLHFSHSPLSAGSKPPYTLELYRIEGSTTYPIYTVDPGVLILSSSGESRLSILLQSLPCQTCFLVLKSSEVTPSCFSAAFSKPEGLSFCKDILDCNIVRGTGIGNALGTGVGSTQTLGTTGLPTNSSLSVSSSASDTNGVLSSGGGVVSPTNGGLASGACGLISTKASSENAGLSLGLLFLFSLSVLILKRLRLHSIQFSKWK